MMGSILRNVLPVLALIALFILPTLSTSQDYLYDQWGVKEGLPQNTINQILQTSDGYIWLATEGGLARFDGVKFTIFNTENTPALSGNRINILRENNNGDLLIGSYRGGLTIYRDNEFFHLSEPESLQKKSIYQFVIDPEDRLWLFLSNEPELTALDANTYDHISDIEQPKWRNVGGDYSLHDVHHPISFDSVDFVHAPPRSKNEHKPSTKQILPRRSTAGQSSEVSWLLDNENLYRCNDFQCTETFPIPEEVYRNNTMQIFTRINDKIYIGVIINPDLLVFDIPTKTFSTLEASNICPNGSIFNVYADRENNIWFATSICGLIKAKPQRFQYLDDENSVPVQNYYPIKLDDQGRILVGTISDDLYIFDENLNYVEQPDYLPKIASFVSSIETLNGAVYYNLIIHNHILKWENDAVQRIYYTDSLTRYAHALYATRKGTLLAGTQSGVFEMVDDQLVPHPVSGFTELGNVSVFHEDSNDRLWIGSDQRIVCYNPLSGQIEFNSADFTAEDRFYRGMHSEGDGRLYVGSYGFGLHIVQDNQLHRITTAHGLAENVVSTITEDSNGYIWFTGNIGLSRVKKSELLEVLSGDRKKLSTVLYNEQTDGLRTGEFNGGIQQSKCWLGGERYVFPSMKGAVIVDFADMQFNTLPPPVHIEKLSYNDSTILAEAAVEMPYADGRLDIFYTALSYVSPKNVRFKYRLEGYDEDWIDAGAERKTSYSKIPPGEYTFRVIASNNEGVWNEEGSEMAIHIVPPFHMTWWFRTGVILLGFLLTVFAVSRIIAFRRKRERDKSALMDILPDLVFKMDRNGRYLDIYGNPENLSKPIPQNGEQRIDDLLPGGLTPEAQQLINRAFETGAMQEHTYSVNGEKSFESRYIAIDRHEVLCIIRDITEAKEAERQIRKSEKRLLKALEKEKELLKAITRQQKMQLEAIVNTEEKERKRIARDLHDGVGQLLSSVKINLGVAMEYIARSKVAETTELLAKSKMAIDEITGELRNISYNLLPPSLEQFGLASAIAEEVNKLKSNPELFVHFDNSTTDLKFDPKVEIVLFRVFQELLNNALKHAQASEITIQLIQHKAELVMMIEDNGRGFELRKSVEKKDSSGLKNLYSRIAFIDGKISVDSTPLSGTSIIIEIPLKS